MRTTMQLSDRPYRLLSTNLSCQLQAASRDTIILTLLAYNAMILCGTVYVTVQCPCVCLSYSPTAAACCGFAAVGPASRTAGDIDRSRRPPGAEAARKCEQ